MNKHERLESLIQERETYVTRIFWTGLEIAFMFAIPLALAIVLIKFVTNGFWSWVVLILAFVSSWLLVIRKYNKLSKIMMRLDGEIRQLRSELGVPVPTEHRYPDEQEDEA